MSAPYLSVVIPAFQESQRITKTLDTVLHFLSQQSFTWEVLVVDDGSSDGTNAVVQRIQAGEQRLKLLQHQSNRGKGAAVRTGMRAAEGTYALFADADNATPFGELTKLLSVIQTGQDIVIGSRYVAGSNVVKKQSLIRRMMSRSGNRLFQMLLGLHYADTRCGFKLFTQAAQKTVFARQTLERWGFDTEILVIADTHHLRVQEVPVEWYDRVSGNIHPLRDSLRSIKELVHIWRNMRRGIYH